jgi:hypothetical protein
VSWTCREVFIFPSPVGSGSAKSEAGAIIVHEKLSIIINPNIVSEQFFKKPAKAR